MSLTLEERFAATIDELELPEADLVTAVMTRVVEPRRTAPRPRRLAIVGVVAVIVIGLTLAIEPAREAVANRLGLGATKVEVIPTGELSSGLPSNATTAPDSSSSTAGDVTSTANADAPDPLASDPIHELGPPSGFDDAGLGRGRRFTWPAGPRLDPLGDSDVGAILSVRIAEGELDLKRLLGDAELEFVLLDIGSVPINAMWIGAEHEYIAAGSEGPVLSDKVLIWVVDGLQYRLEANLPRDEMIELAEGTEGGTDLLRPG